MRIYLYPVSSALVDFPILALALTIPYVFYSYRRYGSVSFLRSAVLFSFVFYLLVDTALDNPPLPDPAEVARETGPYAQLVPFTFVRRFLARTSLNLRHPSTYLGALKQSVLFQPLFNILLTMPFGAYLAYYFKQGTRRTVLLAFLLSLFFEITQLTGLYGLYSRPYRLFDVDDLMLNTLGGYLGHWVGMRIRAILPTKERMDEASLRRSERVSYTRRFFAACVDYGVLVLLMLGLELLTGWQSVLIFPTTYFAYFVGLGSLLRGRTPGKMLVRIRTVRVGTRAPLPLLLLVKYVACYLPLLYAQYTATHAAAWGRGPYYAVLASYAVLGMALVIDTVHSLGRGKRLWYERLSRTANGSYLDVERLLQPSKG